MGHLENVESIARANRQDEEERRRLSDETLKRWEIRQAQFLHALDEPLATLAMQLRSRASIVVSNGRDWSSPTLTVAITSAPLWVRAPYRKFVMRVSSGASDYFKDHSEIHYVVSDEKMEVMKEQCCSSSNEVLKILEEACAEYINNKQNFLFQVPGWYATVGSWAGVFAAALFWLGVSLSGWIGVVFGWLPAILVFHVARFGWLPLCLLGIFGIALAFR